MRLSQNDSMLSESPQSPDAAAMPLSAIEKIVEWNGRFSKSKATICTTIIARSTNALLQRHCLPSRCKLSCSQSKSQAVSAGRAGISRWRSFARWAGISRWRSSAEQGPQKGPLFKDCLSTARYARPSVGIERPSLTPCSEAPQKRRSRSKG